MLVEVSRSGHVESVHRGSVVVLGPDGAVRFEVGDVHKPVFTRSANKPFQALGMLRAGLKLSDDADLAISCGSHSGEPEHVDRVLRILARHDLTEQDLGCPPDYPSDEYSRDRLLASGGGRHRAAMNCSGKHAAMLATCVQVGWPVDAYLKPDHPLQVLIAETITQMTGDPITAVGIDGCGAPLFALTLHGLAAGYSHLMTGMPGSRRRRIADAMIDHPYLVAGTERDDTELMRAVPGLVAKVGAEGVQAVALPDGTAIALKIDDGAPRARRPTMVGVLEALGVPGLEELSENEVLGGGRQVGAARLRPDVLDGL